MMSQSLAFGQSRPRDLGILIGVMQTGPQNAITDVAGVKVGETTLINGENVRTGVTAIIPHQGNLFQSKVPAAVFVGNGFGKLAGTTQIEELGNIESPIILTNTLGVAAGIEGVVVYTLVHTPRLCGQESRAADLLFLASVALPFLTNC